MSQPYLNGLLTIGSTCPLGCGCEVDVFTFVGESLGKVGWKGFLLWEKGLGLDSMIFPCLTWGVYQKLGTFLPEISQANLDDCCWMAFSGHD